MDSLKNLFIIGPGPSSSHTIGPKRAAENFLAYAINAKSYKVELYNSFALTGKGHLTDRIVAKTLGKDRTEVKFMSEIRPEYHPNTMIIYGLDQNKKIVYKRRYSSLGGGAIAFEGKKCVKVTPTYPFKTFKSLNEELDKLQVQNYAQVVDYYEKEDINKYLENIIDLMFKGIEKGLHSEGILPGCLKLKRVANCVYLKALQEQDPVAKILLLLSAYSYATAENNASGEEIVAAPTCGSSGVVPALLYYAYHHLNTPKEKLIEALKVAGIVGNIVKHSASISGAVLGCQAEIGTATSMAAGAYATILGLTNYQIEYACEVAMEHNLGLTCDPVKGYVQIPCIERNGISALRAYESVIYAQHIALSRRNMISFDQVIKAMKMTGDQMVSELKETSLSGLAKVRK